MTWRTIIISNRAKLDLKMNYMVVRQVDKTQKIFIDEISLLMIETTAVSITTALLSALINKKVKIIFCDSSRNPSSELIPFYGCHDSSSKVRRQIKWKERIKLQIWTEIVREKINKQRNFLNDIRKVNEAKLLEQYLNELEMGDVTNREGHAAKVYFNALFGLEFSRGQDSPINAALNYGYQIILSVINRDIVANGYITQLGLFHDNMFNPFNLGSDLMEPYRILVDRKVYSMNLGKFDKDEKLQIIDILNEYVRINNKRETVLNSIKIYCKSVFDSLDQEDLSCLRMYRNEL